MLSALKFMISPKKHYEDNSSLLDKWAKEVYKAGNNTCIRCGAVGVRLPRRKIGDEWYSEKWKDVIIDAHHVYPKSIYPKLYLMEYACAEIAIQIVKTHIIKWYL